MTKKTNILVEENNLLAAVPVPLLVVSLADRRVLYSNPAFEATYRLQDMLPLLENLQAREFWLRQEHGADSFIKMDSYPTVYGGENAAVVSFQNLTRLKRDEERARILTGFISDYTYSYRVDEQGRLIREWVSEAFNQVTGFLPEEKDLLNDLRTLVHQDDVEIATQQVQDVLAGYPDARDFRIVTKAGEVRWIRSYLHPVKDHRDKVIRVYGMGQDTTHHRKAEEALVYGTAQDIAYRIQTEEKLRNYAAELEAINRELDAYSHTIAHDLKAPLSGILGFIELMEYFVESDAEKAKKYAGRVRESAEYMTRMVSQLLLMARLRNAQETVEKLDMKAVVQSVLIRFASQIEKQQVTIDIAEHMPPAMGHGPWIEEVFANFINNAIKYKGEHNPSPLIQIRGIELNGEIRYEVEDNGIGIKEEDRAKLFEMFTRLHTVEQEGTGLGLSIVHRIVTKLNGRVGVESTYGKGSTFWFTLPKAE